MHTLACSLSSVEAPTEASGTAGAWWLVCWHPSIPYISPCHRLSLLRSLYTCVLEAPLGQEARKWLQLAVFCSPLAPGQTHLQLRVYFLNNTPCALQWALTNEQPHGGRLRGPCQLFDFTGARGDQCLKLKYISEGERGLDRAVESPTQGRGLGLPWVEMWEPQVPFRDSWVGSGFCCCLEESPGSAHFLCLWFTQPWPLCGRTG